jgi:hypothetical protein
LLTSSINSAFSSGRTLKVIETFGLVAFIYYYKNFGRIRGPQVFLRLFSVPVRDRLNGC